MCPRLGILWAASSQLQTSSERLQSSCKGVTRVMRTRVTQIADWNNNLEPNLGMKSVLICYNHGVQWDYYQSKNLISFLALLHEVRRGFPYGLAGLVWCLVLHLMEFGLKLKPCRFDVLGSLSQCSRVRLCNVAYWNAHGLWLPIPHFKVNTH